MYSASGMGGGKEVRRRRQSQPEEDAVETGVRPVVGRLSWEQAHRLELTLRARSNRFSGRGGDLCPGCGRMVKPAEDQLRLAGHVIHTECLCDDVAV